MKRASERHPLITGARVTGLGTLASRVLGMFRDMATGALWGLAGKNHPVADAFLFAFRIPNLFRSVFGEGALAASFLPVLTVQQERDPQAARQLASVVIAILATLLAVLTAAGELALGLIWLIWGDAPIVGLVVRLSAIMLPYLLLICLSAQVSTMLYVGHRFAMPALAPCMLNIISLIAAWIAATWWSNDQVAQAYFMASAVVVSGVAQVAVQLPTLRRLGFRFDYNWPAAREGVMQVAGNMAPTIVSLAILQINTFVSNAIAMALSGESREATISWLGNAVHYPMQQGAVAALYYADRLCDAPLGIVGIPLAVAIFPLLSRHAARNDHDKMGADMTLGLRLLLCLSVPAGAGLALLAQPVTRLIFERGNFNPEDTARVATVVVCYAAGVWANCAWPVVVRGFYALNDYRTPVRVGVWTVGLNLLLNLALVWPLAEAGLAISTTIAAVVQLFILVAIFSRREAPLGWRSLAATAVRTVMATAIMGAVVHWALQFMPHGHGIAIQVFAVLCLAAVGLLAYGVAYLLLGGRELGMLVSGKVAE